MYTITSGVYNILHFNNSLVSILDNLDVLGWKSSFIGVILNTINRGLRFLTEFILQLPYYSQLSA
jgi:hypothetical protein